MRCNSLILQLNDLKYACEFFSSDLYISHFTDFVFSLQLHCWWGFLDSRCSVRLHRRPPWSSFRLDFLFWSPAEAVCVSSAVFALASLVNVWFRKENHSCKCILFAVPCHELENLNVLFEWFLFCFRKPLCAFEEILNNHTSYDWIREVEILSEHSSTWGVLSLVRGPWNTKTTTPFCTSAARDTPHSAGCSDRIRTWIQPKVNPGVGGVHTFDS